MDLTTLLFRSLVHHWRSHVIAALGVAVATAVLTGALLVGDSVRGSLRDVALERLGNVDEALVAGRFFREQLAANMEVQPTRKLSTIGLVLHAAPAILLRGSVAHAATGARAGQANVLGVDERFWKLFDNPPKVVPAGNQVLLNESLARELNARAGDTVLVRFEKPSAVPRDSTLGRRTDVVAMMRLTVAAVIPSEGFGRFGLQPNQQLPRNLFVPLATLQHALKLDGRVNTMLVDTAREGVATQAQLQKAITLDDLNVQLRARDKRGYMSLESSRMILEPGIASVALALARDLNTPLAPTFTYLANTIAIGPREIPYSTVTAFDATAEPPFGPLRLMDGGTAPALKDDEILLNEWAASDLQARPGDTVRLSYYLTGSLGELKTAEHAFKLAGIVALSDAADDPNLTPDYPGIADAKSMADWDPPFPVDLKRVRSKDEEYWREHKATPKAFVSLATGQRLWSSRFGQLTSIRFAHAPGLNLAQTAETFERMFRARLKPEQAGLVFAPVREQALRASEGATDFGELFIGFSMFLILSAVLLVALLLRLGIERRAGEIGLLLAQGFPVRTVRRLLTREGALVSAAGGALGLLGAIGYGELMLAGLRSWWLPAVGTPFLKLHVEDDSLAYGYVASLIVALIAVRWAVRMLQENSIVALLAGKTSASASALTDGKSSRRSWKIAAVALVAAVALFGVSLGGGSETQAMGFFGSGVALLVAALSAFAAWLRRLAQASAGRPAIARLGIRNGARHPGRSVLTAGLVASATFVIIAVGAFHQAPADRAPENTSGDGGFALLAGSDVPLHHDLNTPQGRESLNVPKSAALDGVHVMPFRLRPGDDASCLNLYAPEKPRIIGATDAMIERGGFAFQSSLAETAAEKANPWLLLRKDYGAGVVPVFGDYNTVMWILHLDLGKDLAAMDEHGHSVQLRFVGLLQGSIFQSELVMGESHFLKMFPSQNGYSFFLIEAPHERARQVSQTLEESLADFGFDATRTADRLAAFAVVENTYLSTFQTLGGLGLVLGTLGLAAILLRNVVERRGELALMRALGFRRRALATLVLVENGFLLVLGLLCGTLSALLAVGPHLTASAGELPWLQLGVMLALVVVVGMTAGALAVRAALQAPMLEVLRQE